MQIESAFLANWAEVRESLLFVSGGCPEWWSVPSLPAPSHLVAVLALRQQAGVDEAEAEWGFQVEQPDKRVDSLGTVRIRYRRPDDVLPPSVPRSQVLTLHLEVEFKVEGLHTIRLYEVADAKNAVEVPLWVRVLPTP